MSGWGSPRGPEQYPTGPYPPRPGQPPPGGYPNFPGPPGMYPNQYYTQRAPAQPGNGVAVAGLVLGITSVVFCWWGLLTLLQVTLAVIFSSVGISKANHGAANKGLAVAGLVLALVGLVLYFFIGLFSLGIGWVI